MVLTQNGTSSTILTVTKIMTIRNSMNLMFIESDATNYIVKGDIAIIRTEDDHKYYLAKLTTDIYEAEKSERGDYNQEMPAHQKIIACSYLLIPA